MKDDFFNELNEKYTATDFTDHIGVILARDNDFEDEKDMQKTISDAWDFIEDLYNIATKHI